MKEELISIETAKLAKEKGLKLRFCREVFYANPTKPNEFVTTEMIHDYELVEDREWYSRPTQVVLVRWLRETHNIQVYAYSSTLLHKENDETKYINYVVYINGIPINDARDEEFQSYEKAIEYGLQVALEKIN